MTPEPASADSVITPAKANAPGYHIKEIFLDGGFEKYSVAGAEPKKLPGLSKINIFVGPNNSGKSRFMRLLAGTESLAFGPNLAPHEPEDFKTLLSKLITEMSAALKRYTNMPAKLDGCEGLRKLYPIREGKLGIGPLRAFLTGFADHTQIAKSWDQADLDVIFGNMSPLAMEWRERLTAIWQGLPDHFEFRKVYVPVLRGLRPPKDRDATDYYQQRTSADYFQQKEPPVVFTGLTAYQDIQNLLLGNLKQRQGVRKFEEFLSQNFFDGKSVALIPKLNQDVLDVKIGDEAEYPIHQLGDGLQSIIILTFPLYQAEAQGSMLLGFFEEPELFMHPGMQRAFLKSLTERPGAQFFLTTHSNHFLDITLDFPDVSIFTFRKELDKSETPEKTATFAIQPVSEKNNPCLELLGVRNSSVFLSNCTIWVEGITDRRYFAHFLALYLKKLRNADASTREYREDLHFSFVEYGGSNITHWSFLDAEEDPIDAQRLCSQLFLITDKDKGRAKEARHKELGEALHERYHCLECREVENLLTPEVIGAVVADYEGCEVDQLRSFLQSDYADQPLGSFIEASVLAGPKKRKGSYASESGTIADKMGFSRRAIKLMETNSFDELSPEAQRITIKLYQFIEQHNR